MRAQIETAEERISGIQPAMMSTTLPNDIAAKTASAACLSISAWLFMGGRSWTAPMEKPRLGQGLLSRQSCGPFIRMDRKLVSLAELSRRYGGELSIPLQARILAQRYGEVLETVRDGFIMWGPPRARASTT